jgi:hypothetical protein
LERPLCHTSEPDWFNRSSLSASPQIQSWFDDKRIADSKIVTYRQTMRVEVAIQCCDAEYTRIMGNTWLARFTTSCLVDIQPHDKSFDTKPYTF